MFRAIGLDECPARLLAAPGAPCHLRHLRPTALARPRIARIERQIGIDHADQRQMWEMMALGDELRADDEIMHTLRHFADGVFQQAAPRQIARQNGEARLGKPLHHFLGQSFDPRPAGHELARCRAFGTLGRYRLGVTAMMAHQLFAEPVLHQRGGAIGTIDAMSAGAAQGQRRIAAPIEEEQSLVAAIEGFGHRLGQRFRQP